MLRFHFELKWPLIFTFFKRQNLEADGEIGNTTCELILCITVTYRFNCPLYLIQNPYTDIWVVFNCSKNLSQILNLQINSGPIQWPLNSLPRSNLIISDVNFRCLPEKKHINSHNHWPTPSDSWYCNCVNHTNTHQDFPTAAYGEYKSRHEDCKSKLE